MKTKRSHEVGHPTCNIGTLWREQSLAIKSSIMMESLSMEKLKGSYRRQDSPTFTDKQRAAFALTNASAIETSKKATSSYTRNLEI
ncbi:uncharacterized protein G2W53_029592 [Senna tora]|uniref:Uncharacterized protein n=1 Tax=Senna tora TaxID=362788 RepID=A0A834T5T2_9FABA|nr:uncharacterized protein G2W53_029592 [Senna tora]